MQRNQAFERGARGNVEAARHKCNALFDGNVFEHRLSQYQHITAVFAIDACNVLQQRGFSCAVWTNKPVDRSCGDVHINAVQRNKITETLR